MADQQKTQVKRIVEAVLHESTVGSIPALSAQTRIYIEGHSNRPAGAPRAGTVVQEIRLTQRGLEFDHRGQHYVVGSGSWVFVIEKSFEA